MIFSKHILAAACIVLLGTACTTTPVADEPLSADIAGCTLPEVEEMEKPLTGEGKENKGEGKTQKTADCTALPPE